MNEESRNWIEKRNSFNAEIKRLREEAFLHRDKRDALNKAVQELKAKRDQAKQELPEKRKLIDSLDERIRALESKVTLREGAAQKRLRELEWTIQTNSLSMAEEKRMIVEVKSLELELGIFREIGQLRKEASKLLSEIRRLQSAIDEYHSALSRLARESQECHEQMLESLSKADPLTKEAGSAHQNFVEIKKKADDLHRTYSGLISRIREIELLIRQVDVNVHREQIRKALESREKVSKQAQQKLQTGEKLTFEEFKLLIERGEV